MKLVKIQGKDESILEYRKLYEEGINYYCSFINERLFVNTEKPLFICQNIKKVHKMPRKHKLFKNA